MQYVLYLGRVNRNHGPITRKVGFSLTHESVNEKCKMRLKCQFFLPKPFFFNAVRPILCMLKSYAMHKYIHNRLMN